MVTAVATTNGTSAMAKVESVLVSGDLSKLTPDERVVYYNRVCQSLDLNPFTKPFEYITLNGKLTLYARKDCTDQLRNRDHVSVKITSRELQGEVFIVAALATLPGGRTDESIGAVSVANLKGDNLANAMMKAETKAKRRVTLSICGLGMLDESEVDSIPGAVSQVHQPNLSEPVKNAAALKHGAPTPDDFVDVLKGCKSLPELAREWDRIPTQLHKVLSPVKDALKARFAAAAKTQEEPPQGDHATGDGDAEPEAYIGREMAQAILDLLNKLGIDWAEVRDNHGKGLGLANIAGFQALLDVKVTELTPEQGLRLHGELKKRLAAKPVPTKAGAA